MPPPAPDRLDLTPTERFVQSVLPSALVALTGELLHVNPALCRLTRCGEAEVLGGPAGALGAAPEDAESVAKVLALLAGGSAGEELALRLARCGAEPVPVRSVWSLVRTPSGTPSYATVVLVDETEQEAARHAARHWRARFAHSSVPQGEVDLDGRVVEFNLAHAELLGSAPEELVGRSLAELTHDSDDGSADPALASLLRGEVDAVRYERVMRHADGRPVPLRVDVTLLRDQLGRPQRAAAFCQDLSVVHDLERRRQQQEDFFLALSARASDLAAVLDEQGRVRYASAAVRHVFGYDAADVVAASGWDFVHPDDLPAAHAAFDEVLAGRSTTVSLRMRMPDGSWRWVEQTLSNLLATPVGGIVANLRDVHEQVEAEQALRRSEARYRALADTAQEGIWVTSTAGTTLYANRRMADLLGLALRDVYERSAQDLLDPEQAGRARRRPARGATDRYELRYRHPDGGERVFSVATSLLAGWDGGSEGLLAMVSDVTEARRAEEELSRAALQDALTGLPNRALLLDRLAHALDRETSGTAVVLLDVDQFRLVNDSHGHDVGDALLVEVAARLRSAAPAGETVARFGGDTFAVVCEGVDQPQAQALAEELLLALSEPLEVDGAPFTVRASAGVAVSPASSASDLVRYADTALHAAKSAGRRRVRVYERCLSEQLEDQYVLAGELERALADEALEMHYQPLVDLSTGRVVGVEALARWESPRLGPVPPSRFVPVAEQTGLAEALDAFAVRRALHEAARLRADGLLPPDATVAVNLSARSLAEDDLADVVRRATADAGLRPEHVVLEITEGALVDDARQAARFLRRLRDEGFGVAVDDFGTGYSSLAYLRDLPVTTIKIDRSFVAGIEGDSDAVAIVASIVDLARAVGVGVLAEGVETEGQAALLRTLGCRTAQGWLWSRALPPARIAGAGWSRGFGAPVPADAAPPRRRRTRRVPSGPVLPQHGLDRLLAMHRQGASLTTIAAALNGEGLRTPDGLRWHRTTVARAVADAAYPQLDRGTTG